MPKIETNTRKIVSRLEREGWELRAGGRHDVYTHPEKPGRVVVPRHRELVTNTARNIAKQAGWL